MRLSPLFYLINFQYHNYSIIIGIKFEWDEEKAALNLKKHKVSFEEAKTVFYDPNALLISDPEHSTE